jgi:hypothetical protein
LLQDCKTRHKTTASLINELIDMKFDFLEIKIQFYHKL